MKKLAFLILAVSFLTLNSQAFAGKVKDVVIDAEDAIYREFYENGDRTVLSIEDHKFVSVKNGIGVQATVFTRNIHNGVGQRWLCVVSFEKNTDNSFDVRDVDCSGL